MLKEFKMIEAVAPDMLDVLQERFQILRNIYWMQPIGRRSLSETMGITERVLRTETDVLKQLNLIERFKKRDDINRTRFGSLPRFRISHESIAWHAPNRKRNDTVLWHSTLYRCCRR